MRIVSAQAEANPAKRLDRNQWHNPLVSIVVTHHNYSDHIEDALLSLLDQTHSNWECVVVDDASDAGHRMALERIVAEIGCDRIRIVWKALNTGQIPAFFAGIDATRGEFVCLLDPDDRYTETFLAEMLDAHLNEAVYCPIACADQIVMHNDTAITGTYSALPLRLLGRDERTGFTEVPKVVASRLFYVPPQARGWHWTSTSAMMFRRAAINLMRPHRPLAYKVAADTYLAGGAHLLGGTLRLTRPLIYRTSHADNAWMSDCVFATTQGKRKPGGTEVGHLARADVVEALKANGAQHYLAKSGKRWILARWKRSLAKKWRRIARRHID